MSDQNRLDLKGGSVDRIQAEYAKFTPDGAIRTVESPSAPNYARISARTVTAADSAPSSSTVAQNGKGFREVTGHVVFTSGSTPSVDLELWLHNPAGNVWFRSSAVSGVLAERQFRLPHLDGHDFFVRVSAYLGSPTNATLHLNLQ